MWHEISLKLSLFNNEIQNNAINVRYIDQAYINAVNKTVTFRIINQMFTQWIDFDNLS